MSHLPLYQINSIYLFPNRGNHRSSDSTKQWITIYLYHVKWAWSGAGGWHDRPSKVWTVVHHKIVPWDHPWACHQHAPGLDGTGGWMVTPGLGWSRRSTNCGVTA